MSETKNSEVFYFLEAKPVWQSGETLTMNRTVSFCADVEGSCRDAVLFAAASCSYVVSVNGMPVAHGPQRCAHGFYRVDEIPLGGYLHSGANTVAVRVAGYNCNSFSNLDQPSFFCGEIRCGEQLLAYTGRKLFGFRAYPVTERIQKTQRYSYQRTFAEAYDLSRGDFGYESGRSACECNVDETEPKCFLRRNVPYGDYEVLKPRTQPVQGGTVGRSDKDTYYTDRQITNITAQYKGFPLPELEYASHIEYGKLDFSEPHAVAAPAKSEVLPVAADSYVDLDFCRNYTGCFEFTAEGDCDELWLAFDEIMQDGQLDPFRLSCANMISWRNIHGTVHLFSAEPYTLRYLRVAAIGGAVKLRGLHLNKIAFPSSGITAHLKSEDEGLRAIFDAARETFCANAVDIYMDCPSRERAGWLCDSFFTSRVERVLTGKSEVEHAFLENFLLPDSFRNLPRGMLPMCYPSDFDNGTFIPNWAMWYVIELAEYLERTGDSELVAQAKPRLYALDRYFRRFENEFGLLEHLESWVFIEWSKANELLQDVSYASNMLYVGYKHAMAALYDDAHMAEEADCLTQTIRNMAMTPSGFFCDNAVRRGGQLVLSGERTEACQYYAFFFGVATPETHPELWNILLTDFGPDRVKQGKYPEIYPANVFIGNYLRLDVLCRLGCRTQLLENIRGYFAYMAETTGTLWEMDRPTNSCNHGFASHVIYWLNQLGLVEHDC